MKTKLEVGDKVRIRKDLSSMQVYGSITYVSSMDEYKGCTATIVNKGRSAYILDIDNGEWNWSAEMFDRQKGKFNSLI